MVLRFRLLLGAAGAGALTLALIGASNSAQINKAGRLFRPQPQATSIVGNTTGPLLYVENDGTTAFNTFATIGAVGGGPGAIGVLGFGANAGQGNIGVLGYDVGPGAVAAAGYAALPTQSVTTTANQTVGVEGIAPNGNGVVGQTSVTVAQTGTYAGVVGIDAAFGGTNVGVLGKTTTGTYGVEGVGGNFSFGGVHGYTTADYEFGVAGTCGSTGCTGVGGTGVNGLSGYGSYYGTTTAGPKYPFESHCIQQSGCYPVLVHDENGANLFYIDDSGNVTYHGTLTQSVRTRSGNFARGYASSNTAPTMEDTGTAQLVNGAAVVRLDSAFADMSDGRGYQVFLTPQADSNGLYVTRKTPASFVVRESHGGRSTLAFDYRIVARANGHSLERSVVARSPADLGAPNAALPQHAKIPDSSSGSTARFSVPNLQLVPRAVHSLLKPR